MENTENELGVLATTVEALQKAFDEMNVVLRRLVLIAFPPQEHHGEDLEEVEK